MATQIQVRRDTQTDWDAVSPSPVLAEGEIGLVVDSSAKIAALKIGDGVSTWKELEFSLPVMSGVDNTLEPNDAGTAPINQVTTFVLRGVTGQTSKVLGIKNASGTVTLSVDMEGVVAVAGAVTADGAIQSGTYATNGATSGAQLKDNVDHGQLLISSTDAADLTDVAIKVNTAEGGVADKFTVAHSGAVVSLSTITSAGLTTTAGIANSGAAITMDDENITGLATSSTAANAVNNTRLDAAIATAVAALTSARLIKIQTLTFTSDSIMTFTNSAWTSYDQYIIAFDAVESTASTNGISSAKIECNVGGVWTQVSRDFDISGIKSTTGDIIVYGIRSVNHSTGPQGFISCGGTLFGVSGPTGIGLQNIASSFGTGTYSLDGTVSGLRVNGNGTCKGSLTLWGRLAV